MAGLTVNKEKPSNKKKPVRKSKYDHSSPSLFLFPPPTLPPTRVRAHIYTHRHTHTTETHRISPGNLEIYRDHLSFSAVEKHTLPYKAPVFQVSRSH